MHAYSPILAPVVALIAWTLIILIWMIISRGAEFRRLGISFSNMGRGFRGGDLEGRAEPSSQWKAHNYNHLLEQPTIFYAVALSLAMMNFGSGINYWLAWGYVGFRVLHSLVQCTVNIVAWRFTFFLLASLCLIGLTTHAGLRILHDCGILRF
jgi:hypothetical protein